MLLSVLSQYEETSSDIPLMDGKPPSTVKPLSVSAFERIVFQAGVSEKISGLKGQEMMVKERMDGHTEIEAVVKRLQKIGDYQWCKDFFTLACECIRKFGVDDKRWILTLPNNAAEIVIQLNNRNILKAHAGGKLSLMLPLEMEKQLNSLPNLDQFERFTDSKGNTQAFWVRLAFPSAIQLGKSLYNHWYKAVKEEVQRNHESPFQKYDRPILHRMLADDDYLEYVLTLAFGATDIPLAEEIPNDELLHEGAKKTIIVNAYERNSKAKSQCTKHWGFRCIVCGFDFKEKYGWLGREYIHVHHLKPLSQIGKTYTVDPTEDLRPVCPNCHSMLHRNPKQVLSIEELKSVIDHPEIL